jgi:hypothetical protein
MKFTLRIKNMAEGLGMVSLACIVPSNCEITYRKTHTPKLFYIAPPVVYYESTTEVWFDPKNTVDLIQDLDSDEYPFINTKLGGSLLDFEFNVDDTTTFNKYAKNRVVG